MSETAKPTETTDERPECKPASGSSDGSADLVLARRICDYLNDLAEHDRPAIAALIANRVPCNRKLAEHPTCECGKQHGGFNVGWLGILNGLCRGEVPCYGPIEAVFGDPPDLPEDVKPESYWLDLVKFHVVGD